MRRDRVDLWPQGIEEQGVVFNSGEDRRGGGDDCEHETRVDVGEGVHKEQVPVVRDGPSSEDKMAAMVDTEASMEVDWET